MYSYSYPRAALTTDAIVYEKNSSGVFVLLIRRGAEPFRGKWALPGGFVDMDETLETACIRELAEETGLEIESMSQFRVYDAIDRDPRHRTISVVFSAELNARRVVRGGDDADRAAWFPLSGLPALAFDHHRVITDFFEL